METAWLILTAGTAFAAVAACRDPGPAAPAQRRHPTAVLVLAIVGAALGAIAPGEPTRLAVLDVVLRALFGVVCVLAAATTGPRARLVAAGSSSRCLRCSAPAGDLPAMLAAGAALATVAIGVDGAVLGAGIGLAIGQAALRLGWPRHHRCSLRCSPSRRCSCSS